MTQRYTNTLNDMLPAGNGSWVLYDDYQKLEARIATLTVTAAKALIEMQWADAPSNSFTDAVDALDAALHPKEKTDD